MISFAIPNVLQVSPDELVQFLRLLGLFAQGGRQLGHFLLERLTVVFDLGCTDIAARGENVIMPAYVVGRCGFAETGDILVGANLCVRLRIGLTRRSAPTLSPRHAW